MIEKLHPYVNIGGGKVYINPGTGAIEGAFEANAIQNIRQFIKDCDTTLKWHWRRAKSRDYGEGRFAFMVFCDEFKSTKIEIQMPGWELGKVRYLDPDTQNIWEFPRLYVDGSSWVWKFAIIGRDYFDDPNEWTNDDDITGNVGIVRDK